MLNAPSRKSRCAFLNWCLPLEYSLMMRMTFWVVGMRRYIASWSTCGSYNGELISIIPSRKLQITDVLQCPTSHVPVTISSRISFLLSALNKICLEWSSTTSIFHLVGGWTDRMASRNSTTIIKKRSIFIDTVPHTFSCNLNERSHEQWMSVWKDSSWAATGGRLAEAVTRWYN